MYSHCNFIIANSRSIRKLSWVIWGIIPGNFNCKNSNWFLQVLQLGEEPVSNCYSSHTFSIFLLVTTTNLETNPLQNLGTFIYMVFTNKAHLVMESGVYSSKINLKVSYLLFWTNSLKLHRRWEGFIKLSNTWNNNLVVMTLNS